MYHTATTPRPPGRDRDSETLIETLYVENSKLKSLNASLNEKIKQLQEQLKKKDREVLVTKQLAAQYKQKNKSVSTSKENLGPQEIEIRPAANPNLPSGKKAAEAPASVTDSNLLELARNYKARLTAAEAQLKQLREENNKIRSSSAPAGGASASGGASVARVGNSNELESQLRDTTWKLQQLQTQYDYLVSKTSAQGNAQKSTEDQIEDYAHKVRDLRRALEELRHEKNIVDSKASRAEELEDTVRELRQENRSLLDKISRLCEAPYMGDAMGIDGRMRHEEMAREREELLAKVNLLQDSIRTKHAALESLRQQADKLRLEKEEAERKADGMKNKLEEVNSNASLLQNKLRLYSGDDGIDLESLEHALTLVKRRSQALEKLNFLEDPEGDTMLTLPLVKRKLDEVQIMNLRLTEEVERLESMLKLQSGINKDLHQELEALVHKRDKDKRDLETRAEDFEELAMRRLETIHKLEAQIKELTYGVSGKKNRASGGRGDNLVSQRDQILEQGVEGTEVDNALLAELIDEKGGDAPAPFENLLEVWVRGGTLRDGLVGPGSSTFVVIDFFDYESQTTSPQVGSKPQWDFAATYKINVDDFLLRYLATDVITLELNMASQGDFSMLARCTVPVNSLLKSKPVLKLKNHPMFSVSTGEALAHINLEMKLALPVSELYRLFLERHPGERARIEEITSKRALESVSALEMAKSIDVKNAGANDDDNSRLYNELEIVIHKASSLPPSKDGKAPQAYVHFQLLGHPDKFTNPVANTTDPSFNEHFVFPMLTNDQQLRLLQRSKLQLTVIDMKGEEDDAEGFIGETIVSLAEVADGHQTSDTFSIKDAVDKKVGELSISIKWKYTFRRQRELGPRSLSGVEVETLISAFSAGEVKEGVVDYMAFCRFIDPPFEVRGVMERLRSFCRKIANSENRTSRSIFGMILDDNTSIPEETFVENLLRAHVDASQNLSPQQLKSLFRFIDMDEDGLITLDQLLAVLNLDEDAGVPTALQEKLRERTRDLDTRNISPLRMFKDADQWGPNGLVTRMEFKGVLKRMGFHLADEPEPVSVSSGIHGYGPNDNIADPYGYQKQAAEDGDILNDTVGSGDEILIGNDSAAPDRMGGGGQGNRKNLEYSKQQREIFEDRRAEMQQRSMEAAALQLQKEAEAGTLRRSVDVKLPEKAPVIRQSASELATDPYQLDNHRVGMVKTGAGPVVEVPDTAPKETSGARDSNIRTEKVASGIALQNPSDPKVAASQDNTFSVNILDAEATIRKSLVALQGIKSIPNFIGGFQTVDTKRSGFVSRKQFAHVISQFQDISLSPGELRACMDFFDLSNNGTEIDYHAFCKMCRYQQPELLPALDKLQKMVFTPNTLSKFRSVDTVGTGYIRRPEMLRVLTDLGYGQIASTTLLNILELFETRVDGQVNYNNFVDFVRENKYGKALDNLSTNFFLFITKGNNRVDDGTIKDAFKKICREGSFNFQQFVAFVESQEIISPLPPREVMSALFQSMEKDGRGVFLNDLISWARIHADDLRNKAALHTSLSLAELQRKANKYMLAVASASPAKLDDITRSYLVYDWTKQPSGTLQDSLFANATKRAGFPFTSSEIRLLSAEFSSKESRKVNYRKFLSWATPDDSGLIKTSMTELAAGGRRTTSGLIKFLESTLQRGVDLLSIFSRYDSSTPPSGRITADDFCSALSEIGYSSATQKEALELADSFKAAAGDFIMYRRIFADLLPQIDEASGAAEIDVIDVIRSHLIRGKIELRRLRDLFEYYDRKNNGKVREEDLGTIFEEATLKLRRQELQAIADRYSVGGSGWVQYSSLLSALETRLGEKQLTLRTSLSAQVPEDLKAKLRDIFEKLVLRGKDFRAELDKFDEEFKLSVLQADFREVMQERFRAGLSSREIEILEKAYRDPKDPRRVSHVKMIRELHPNPFGADRDSHEVALIWDLAEELRTKIRKRCDYLTPGELHRPFRHFARKKGSNTVGRDDLSIAIKNLGLAVAADQEDALFDMINLSHGKAFSYSDFLVFVCDPQHHDVIWKLRRLMSRNRISEREIIDSMNNADTSSSGLLTLRQFTSVLKGCNLDMSDTDIARIMLRFDTEESQRIDIVLFSRFLRGQPLEIDDDHSLRESSSGGVRDSVETQAWEALRRRVEAKLEVGFTTSEVFGIFDIDGKGTLDIMSLQQGAREVGAVLSRAEARGVLRRMSVLVGGPVDKRSFFEALELDKNSNKRMYRSDDKDRGTRASSRDRDDSAGELDDYRAKNRVGGASSDHITHVVDILREKIDRACKDGDLTAEDLFRRTLLKHSRPSASSDKMSLRDFEKALDFFDTRLSAREIAQIFDAVDTDGKGSVDVRDIIDFVFPRRSARSSSRERETDKGRGSDRDLPSSSLTTKGKVASSLRRRPDLLDEVISQLNKIKSSSGESVGDLLLLFRRADSHRAGFLERNAFAKQLSYFGFRMRSDFERDLVDTIGDGEPGINYEEFCDVVKDEISSGLQADDILERLRKRISRDLKRGSDLEEMFERLDHDRSGSIQIDEFERGMEKLGIPISRDESKRIVAKYSPNGISISFRDFMRAFHPSSSANEVFNDLVTLSLDRIRRSLNSKYGSTSNAGRAIKAAFEQIDVDGNGKVDRRELKLAMADLKVDLTKEETDAVFDAIARGEKMITYTKFIDFIKGGESEDAADERDRDRNRKESDIVRDRDRDYDRRDRESKRSY